jgi:rhomboid protease GluP
MPGGITPNKIVTIPLGEYNSDHYLTLVYQAMLNRDWDIGYFDHDGIIAYTPISWASYSEEVSVRVKDDVVIFKSECVGYQALWTSYGKNKKNLDLLLDEITYAEYHLQNELAETTQELMNTVPEKQFLNLDDPPMAGKEQLRGFFSPIIPQKKYLITPLLVILNTLVFIATSMAFKILPVLLSISQFHLSKGETIDDKMYLLFGFNHRTEVLNGQVWRLLTSTFQHFSVVHLFFNMVALVYIGSLIECKLGKWNYLFIYLFTGIISGVTSVMFNYTQISAGASGAIFGLFGVLLALVSTNFYERSARKALLISTAIVVAYNIIPIGEGTDHAAHFGGLISGYIFGWIAYLGMNHQNLFIKKWGIALIGSFIVIVFTGCSVAFLPRYQMTEFDDLMEKTQAITRDLNHDFYNGTIYQMGVENNLSRQDKMDTIEQKALPELKNLAKLSAGFKKLKLPAKKGREAKAEAKLIDLLCQLYQALYLEFKEQNEEKYRPKIDSLTEKVNYARMNWNDENLIK